MPATRNRWMLATAALVLPLLLASCGSNDRAGDGDATTASTATGSASSGEDLTWEDSPLQKEFEGLSALTAMSEEEQQQQMADQTRRVEDLVAECMAEQGFDYQPNTGMVDEIMTALEGSADGLEYAQQYGYGINTQNEEASSETASDPNAEAYEAMSEAERAAWDEALYGEMLEVSDEEVSATEFDWESAGCYGVAQQQVYEVESDDGAILTIAQQPQFAELMMAMGSLYMGGSSDPALVELNQEWSDCMADAGYSDLAAPEDALASIASSTETDEAKLRELEIATATADYTCQESVDYDNRSLQVQFAAEEKFIEDYREDIDAFVAAIEEARGPAPTE